jgi:hypothetical protein
MRLIQLMRVISSDHFDYTAYTQSMKTIDYIGSQRNGYEIIVHVLKPPRQRNLAKQAQPDQFIGLHDQFKVANLPHADDTHCSSSNVRTEKYHIFVVGKRGRARPAVSLPQPMLSFIHFVGWTGNMRTRNAQK